jgi:hypothetical protein
MTMCCALPPDGDMEKGGDDLSKDLRQRLLFNVASHYGEVRGVPRWYPMLVVCLAPFQRRRPTAHPRQWVLHRAPYLKGVDWGDRSQVSSL